MERRHFVTAWSTNWKQPRPSESATVVSGAGMREVDEREAGRLLSEGMRLLKLKADQLEGLAKNDSRKQALAWLVRMQTSVRNAWVCDQLRMGHVANVSRGVKRMREKGSKEVRGLRKKLSSISICKDWYL